MPNKMLYFIVGFVWQISCRRKFV